MYADSLQDDLDAESLEVPIRLLYRGDQELLWAPSDLWSEQHENVV